MREFRSNTRRHKAFVQQRMKQLEMEFKYLELLSEEEKEYLYNEREQVRQANFKEAEKEIKIGVQ